MFKLTCLLALFTVHCACALTTLNVTLSSDNNPGGFGDPGDLRYCLNTMNQSLNTTPDDYALVFASPMTIQLNGILPLINNSPYAVTITIGNNDPSSVVTINGAGTYPGFFIPMGTVTVQNMHFQNLLAQGGNGGSGISGGGGGLGAGAAIYAPQSFLNGSNPSITLINIAVSSCAARGGNGGSYSGGSLSGNEGGGGGGGFNGNGGSIVTNDSTGGGGGGGYGGDGGNVTLSTNDLFGGGGGGGGGLGSRAGMGTLTNLGNGGTDAANGQDGNGYGLAGTAGFGGGGNSGGGNAGGAGGGANITGLAFAGGGGGGSANGSHGLQAQGSIPPGGSVVPSGGNGADGGGGGGAAVVVTSSSNGIDGQAGTGGYGGGGGGGSGTGSYDAAYTVQGGFGGVGGGGGGGGVNQSGTTPAGGGNSLAGGGGGGAGPTNGAQDAGGTDIGNLGGGAGGVGSNIIGLGLGGGGGGGGSGLGAALFVDSNLNVTLQAIAGTPTTFNTIDNVVQAGTAGAACPGGSDGTAGSALGNSIFLRSGSSLTLMAQNVDDLLTLGDQVSFADDTPFGAGGTMVSVVGNGTVIYNGTTDYPGTIRVNNAHFKVNGLIDTASVLVCRNIGFSEQRGTLSGLGTLTGSVYVNSGVIYPDAAQMLTLGSLTLNPADPSSNTLGSLVHIQIDATNTPSVVAVSGAATLAGALQIDLDPATQTGSYTVVTSSGITGTFDTVTFAGRAPNYTLSYLPAGSPTFVQFDFLGYPPASSLQPASNLQGIQKKNNFGLVYELYNQLTWTLSLSPEVTGYALYRDGTKIATVDNVTTSYQDHNRAPGVSYVYSLVAFDGNGAVSSPISIIVS